MDFPLDVGPLTIKLKGWINFKSSTFKVISLVLLDIILLEVGYADTNGLIFRVGILLGIIIGEEICCFSKNSFIGFPELSDVKLEWQRCRCFFRLVGSCEDPRILHFISLLQILQRAMGLPSETIKYLEVDAAITNVLTGQDHNNERTIYDNLLS